MRRFYEVDMTGIAASALVVPTYTFPESLETVEFVSLFHDFIAGASVGARTPILQLQSRTGRLVGLFPRNESGLAGQQIITTWVPGTSSYVFLTRSVISWDVEIRPLDLLSLDIAGVLIGDVHTVTLRFWGTERGGGR